VAYSLDLKDRRILRALDANARQPASSIARQVGLSTEVVNYRIRRLEDSGIITQYQVIVNLSALHMFQFKICLCLQHMSTLELESKVALLKKNACIKWIISCKGSWDVILSLEAKNLEEIDALKDEVLSHFGHCVRKKSISILVESFVYNRDYLVDDNSQPNSRNSMKRQQITILDELDKNILALLNEHARMPVVAMAERLHTTARIIHYRIKELQKKNVITGFKIALNHEKLGIKFYKAFVHLNNPEKKQVQELTAYFHEHKNITHHLKVLGNWDLEPEFEVPSEQEFDIILEEIKNKFSKIITHIDVITILKEHKFVYL